MALLGEAGGVGASGGGGGEALRSRFESKINVAARGSAGMNGGGSGGAGVASQSVKNDLRRSEKTVEKVSRHTGRDDRATVEQVSSARWCSLKWRPTPVRCSARVLFSFLLSPDLKLHRMLNIRDFAGRCPVRSSSLRVLPFAPLR